jgi:hypothetical protein
VDISLLCHGDTDTTAGVSVHGCSLLQAVKLHYEHLGHGMDSHQATRIGSQLKTRTSSQQNKRNKYLACFRSQPVYSTIEQVCHVAFNVDMQVYEESFC